MSGRLVAASSAAAALVLAAALPAAAQSPPRTVTFREVAKSTTFSYIDNPPRGKSPQRPKFSAGDAFVLNIPLINDAGARRGSLRAKCRPMRSATASTSPAQPRTCATVGGPAIALPPAGSRDGR